MIRSIIVIAVLILGFVPSVTSAETCICACVDGAVVPICDLYSDGAPICPRRKCPDGSQAVQDKLVPPTITVDYLYCHEEVIWNDSNKSIDTVNVCG